MKTKEFFCGGNCCSKKISIRWKRIWIFMNKIIMRYSCLNQRNAATQWANVEKNVIWTVCLRGCMITSKAKISFHSGPVLWKFFLKNLDFSLLGKKISALLSQNYTFFACFSSCCVDEPHQQQDTVHSWFFSSSFYMALNVIWEKKSHNRTSIILRPVRYVLQNQIDDQ